MKKKQLLALSAAAAAVLLTVFSEDAAKASLQATERCINMIVPSLFAFMAISELICRCSLHEVISKPFDRLAGFLFGMPKGLFSVFLISNTAGYPVGINMLKEMVRSRRLSKPSAEAAAVYCYAGGPAYAVGVIGAGVYGCKRVGVIIFLSVLLTNLIFATIINKVTDISAAETDHDVSFDAYSLSESVTSAGSSVLKMCAVIIFFSALSSALRIDALIELLREKAVLTHSWSVLIRSIIEISNITGLHSSAYGAVPFAAAAVGFGGICVQLQLLAVLDGAFSLKLFYKLLPLRLLLNYGICRLMCRFFLADNLPAMASGDEIIVEIDNFVPSICLIMMIFILVFKKNWLFLK